MLALLTQAGAKQAVQLFMLLGLSFILSACGGGGGGKSSSKADNCSENCVLDSDGDGIEDSQDAFPQDPDESADLDGDGVGDNSDEDIDGDNIANKEDSFPTDATESQDSDGDGIGDNSDEDIDGDGVVNAEDQFPSLASESSDLDGDGIGDNSDDDIDGDGVVNTEDEFPFDASRTREAVSCDDNPDAQLTVRVEEDHGSEGENGTEGFDGIIDHVSSKTLNCNLDLLVREFDYNADGQSDRLHSYTYDSYGNTLTSRIETNGELHSETIYVNSYDGNGNRLSQDTFHNGEPFQRNTYSYKFDQLERVEVDRGVDGTVNKVTTYQFTEDGVLSGYQDDKDNDGIVDKVVVYTLDPTTRLVTHTASDNDGDGITERISTTSYHENGEKKETDSIYYEDDGITKKRRYIVQYNELGKQTLSLELSYSDDEETIIRQTTYAYDEQGFLEESVELRSFIDGNTSADKRKTYAYHSNGLLISFSEDVGNDGFVEYTRVAEVDSQGIITKLTERDWEEDDQRYEIAVWTYSFSGEIGLYYSDPYRVSNR